MAKDSLDSLFLKLSRRYMLLAGFWPLKTNSKIVEFFYKILSRFINIYFLAGTLGMFMALPDLWLDKDKVIECLIHAVIYFLSWLKVHFLKSQRILRLLKNISMQEKELLKSSDENFHAIVKKYVRVNNRICTGFASLALNNVLLFLLISSVAIFTFQPDEDGQGNRPTMYFYKLPLIDMDKNYFLIYCFNVASLYCAAFFFVSQEVLILTLIIYALCQIEVFQYVLRNAEKSARDYAKDKNLSFKEAVGIVIRNCVLEHNKVIGYMEAYDKSTRMPMLMEFLSTSFQISLLLFRLLSLTSVPEQIFTVLFLCLVFLHMLVFSWLANEIQIQSIAVSDIIFNDLNWDEFRNEDKILLTVMMMRAQKPLCLNIGGFGRLNIGTFIKVMKASFSYVAFFRNMQNIN